MACGLPAPAARSWCLCGSWIESCGATEKRLGPRFRSDERGRLGPLVPRVLRLQRPVGRLDGDAAGGSAVPVQAERREEANTVALARDGLGQHAAADGGGVHAVAAERRAAPQAAAQGA